MLTTRAWTLLGVGIALTGSGILLGYTDITRLGLLLLLLLGVTAVIARRSSGDLQITRSVQPTSIGRGQRATVTVTAANTSARRSGVSRVREQVDSRLGESQEFVVPAIGPHDAEQLQYVVQGTVRGAHRLGPASRVVEDPFGLTRRRSTDQRVDELIVLPTVTALSTAQPPGAGIGSEGETPQMVALHGNDDVSIRAYHQGDDLRKVHWKTTAHRGELMVRQEDRPSRRSALVLLDARSSGHRGVGADDSFEWAVSCAASVVVRLAELHYSVHLATAETLADLSVDAPGEPGDQLRRLATAATCDGETFRRLRLRAREAVRAGAIVVAILTDAEDRVDDIAAMRQPGASGLAFILDTATFVDPGAAPSAGAHMLRAALAGAGWRVCVVRSTTTVLEAWQEVSRRSLIRVGAL